MAVYFANTEITGIKDLFPLTAKDITGLYFANTELFTVWATYDGALPATYSANGDYLADYRIYGNTVQTGTPTPYNPIMPSGCGELETTGVCVGQYKLPILSNSVVTNIYLGESQATRRIKKVVLTGEENCTMSASTASPNAYCYAFKYSDIGMTDVIYNEEVMSSIPYPQYVCSHFKMKTLPSLTEDNFFTDIEDGEIGANTVKRSPTPVVYNRYIVLCTSQYTTINDFKAYLATQYANGTPVTVWYVLAEPETAVVNEPLMKIGNYADTIDSAQTNVQIPTFAGATITDYAGQSAAVPSRFVAKYRKEGFK